MSAAGVLMGVGGATMGVGATVEGRFLTYRLLLMNRILAD